jgi:regulator of sigma E protease
MDFESILRVLQVALGIGLVIFVHELGHFLAARLNGVRVEVFSIGMGPRVFGWVRGATRYQLALVPIGGYVRMAGEERRADGNPPAPGDLSSKSVGARFFIYSGGVLMNLLFGLVVFPIVFYFGVPLPKPVLGDPLPGGPAWLAGIEGGTEVLEVNGEDVFDYVHIPTSIALADPSGSELLVREPSGATRRLHVVPRYDEADGLRTIDIMPDFERGPTGGFLLEVDEGSPLWDAGARTGDAFLGIEGGPPGLGPIDAWRLAATGATVTVRVAGAGGERLLTVTPIPGPLQPPRAGILPPSNVVAGKRDRALGLDLEPGDRLLEVGGQAILRPGDLAPALVAAAERSPLVPFRADRGGRRVEGTLDAPTRADALALADDIALKADLATTVILVNPGEPAAVAGLRDLDRVVTINGVEVSAWKDTHALIKSAIERELPLDFELERAGADGVRGVELTVAPAEIPYPDYGFKLVQSSYEFRAAGVGEAVRAGTLCSWRFAQETFLTLRRLVSRDVGAKNLGGIISIGAISYSFAESGLSKLFFFLCLLSINLAILNVLPIPLLDGGHLFFLIVEKIKGSPVSERILVYSQVVGLVLLLSLIVFITYNDVVRWFLPPG